MAIYSHSKISTFENCPYQYKLKYIDKIIPDIPQGIEAFMGSIVHEVLEDLHKKARIGEEITKGYLFSLYNSLWNEQYTPDILVVRKNLSPEDYRKMGMRFVRDYYDKFYPFDQLDIIGLETEDKMTLKDGSEWHIRIDKLCCDKEGNYYVCDYKTNSRMKHQEDADLDRQLAMYSIWVKEKFQDAKSVKLVWHMLAFNQEVMSERTGEQLEKLHDEIVEKIENLKKAEKENDFPPMVSKLCEWCLYQNICSEYKKAKIAWERQKTL
jgi:putative RecB family exonuclease